MPVFFIEPNSIRDDHILITGSLAHHLVDSLRIKTGEELWLSEPGGPRYRAEVTRVEKACLTARIRARILPLSRSMPDVTLGIALITTEHFEWAIQKTTELGVAHITPLITHRTVVRPRADRIVKQIGRWQSIAREAAQQSMRWNIPDVTAPMPFSQWCSQPSLADRRFLLWENPDGELLGKHLHDKPLPGTVAVAIGPEGGFDSDEVKIAQENGFAIVSLGPQILRTETAAVAALTLVQHAWGNLG